jgi:hypothetical protein
MATATGSGVTHLMLGVADVARGTAAQTSAGFGSQSPAPSKWCSRSRTSVVPGAS